MAGCGGARTGRRSGWSAPASSRRASTARATTARTPASFDPRAAFIFEGVGKDEIIGDFGLIGGGAAGLELDRADPALGTPPHALVVARSEGLTDTYLLVNEELPINTRHHGHD